MTKRENRKQEIDKKVVIATAIGEFAAGTKEFFVYDRGDVYTIIMDRKVSVQADAESARIISRMAKMDNLTHGCKVRKGKGVAMATEMSMPPDLMVSEWFIIEKTKAINSVFLSHVSLPGDNRIFKVGGFFGAVIEPMAKVLESFEDVKAESFESPLIAQCESIIAVAMPMRIAGDMWDSAIGDMKEMVDKFPLHRGCNGK